jgi:hypothetical protein
MQGKDRVLQSKDGELKAKDGELRAKETIIDMQSDAKVKIEEELVEMKARFRAILANRIVLESGLLIWSQGLASSRGSLTTATARCKAFVNNIMLDQVSPGSSKFQLKSDVRSDLLDLAKCGLALEEGYAASNLPDLYGRLSTDLHHNINPLGSLAEGIYIGGSQPATTLLALVMLRLQALQLYSNDLTVIDPSYKPKCRLVSGRVMAV